MKHTIPTTKIWRQPNRDDYSGELYATKGIDLTSSKGKVKASRATYATKDSATSTATVLLEYPSAFVRSAADSTDKWWALTNTVLFKTSSGTELTDWTKDAIANTPTDLNHLYSDLVEFNSSLVASRSTDIGILTAGTWTTSWWGTTLGQTGMTASTMRPLFVGFQNRLLIGEGQYIHTVDTSNRVQKNRVTLRPEFRIRWIRGNSSAYYIGADHKYGGEGKVFEWDGLSENFNREYGIQSDISFACAVKGEIPYIFNRNGQLMRFTGGGFEEVAKLPIAYTRTAPQFDKANVYLYDGFDLIFSVTPNGMDVIDGNINILINGSIEGFTPYTLDAMPSGIYEYDENIGLYHKYTLGTNRLTGTRTDFGNRIIRKAGALKNAWNGAIIAGFSAHIDNGSTLRHCIDVLSAGPHSRSYIITPKLQTSGETQKWQRIWTKFRAKDSGDTSIPNKLVVKYRTDESVDSNFWSTITWTSTTTFTSTNSNTVGEGNWGTMSVGDEIEIARGTGSGIIAHVVSSVLDGSTYTITIDETIPDISVTGATVHVRNWKKISDITHSDTSPKSLPINTTAKSWIQFKIELRGFGTQDAIELEEIQIISNNENSGTS